MLTWLTWFRWVTLMAALVAAIFYGYNTTPWACMDVTVTAYWVQALGSIAAIIGTWYATKTQLLHANKARKTQQLEDEVGNALIGFDLATDTCDALKHIASKFTTASTASKRLSLGTERLQAVSVSLHNFAARQIPPLLYVEILRLQREVAFTITAVTQVSKDDYPVTARRVKNAERRHAAVLASKVRVMTALNKAQRAAGKTVEAIEKEVEDDDKDS